MDSAIRCKDEEEMLQVAKVYRANAFYISTQVIKGIYWVHVTRLQA